MTDGSDDTRRVLDMPDQPDRVYVVEVDQQTTAKMMERIGKRWTTLFKEARVLVVAGPVEAEGDLVVHEYEKALVKDRLQAIEDEETEQVALDEWGEDDG